MSESAGQGEMSVRMECSSSSFERQTTRQPRRRVRVVVLTAVPVVDVAVEARSQCVRPTRNPVSLGAG